MTLRQEHFRDGELRIKCRGTIAAEFWKKDVENVYNTERDKIMKVLEVKESQWPGKYKFKVWKQYYKVRHGLVVRIAGSHPAGPGSIPGVGNRFLSNYYKKAILRVLQESTYFYFITFCSKLDDLVYNRSSGVESVKEEFYDEDNRVHYYSDGHYWLELNAIGK